MIFIEADENGKILGAAQVKCDNHGIDIGMTDTAGTMVTKKFLDEEFAQSSNVSLDTFMNNTRNYVFFKDRILTRPSIRISCSLTDKSDDDIYLAPINTDVELTVEYFDPDNVGYYSEPIPVYIKDDSDFLNIEDQYSSFELVSKKVIIVQSAFPGICRLKAKDVNKLCNYNRLLLRFKQ